MRPWEIAHYQEKHHAIPLADGWWRGPAPQQIRATELLEHGLILGDELADGSFKYFPLPKLNFTTAKIEQGGADWITARIDSGRRCFQSAPKAPRIMAILNLTKDSFSDGGKLNSSKEVLAAATQLLSDGASILDLGAESTRPGAQAVSVAQQIELLIPAIAELRPLGATISIDTRSAEVASACLAAGATMINDVSAFGDPQMAAVVAAANCPTVLMHMRGTPADMQQHCQYQHLLGEIADELSVAVHSALKAGVASEQIIIDPGFGFAKTAEQCCELLAKLGNLRALGFPILSGPSRKSFLSLVTGQRPAHQREAATSAAASLSVNNGAEIIRLHQAAEHIDAINTAFRCSNANRFKKQK